MSLELRIFVENFQKMTIFGGQLAFSCTVSYFFHMNLIDNFTFHVIILNIKGKKNRFSDFTNLNANISSNLFIILLNKIKNSILLTTTKMNKKSAIIGQ